MIDLYMILVSTALNYDMFHKRSHLSLTCLIYNQNQWDIPSAIWANLPLLPSGRASQHFGWHLFPISLRVGG